MDGLVRALAASPQKLLQEIFQQFLQYVGNMAAPLLLAYHLQGVFALQSDTPMPLQYRNPLTTAVTRTISKFMGHVARVRLPRPLNVLVMRFYCAVFGANASEAQMPLHRFDSVSDFFTRHLVPGARQVHPTAALVCPCDGTLLTCGEVVNGRIPQVKGHAFPVEELLLRENRTPAEVPSISPACAFDAELAEVIEAASAEMDASLGLLGQGVWASGLPADKKRMFCVVYLAPGDYHRFHAPTDFRINRTAHIPGTLHPVHGLARRYVPWLFCQNERVVLDGEWEFGEFTCTAVAAFGVGDIRFTFDEEISCNKWEDVTEATSVVAAAHRKAYPDGKQLARGEDMGYFTFGSTLVLVFDAPRDFQFTLPMGRVRMGEALGDVVPATTA